MWKVHDRALCRHLRTFCHLLMAVVRQHTRLITADDKELLAHGRMVSDAVQDGEVREI